jgi:hypothetical protein
VTLIERIGLYIVVPALALLVTGLLCYQAGEKHKAAEWSAAVAAEQHRVDDLNAKLGAAESDNAKLATQINQTVDQLEAARENRTAQNPPDPLKCPDAVDDAADLGELRKLIEPR